MEPDKNPFPKFERLIPGEHIIRIIGRTIGRVFTMKQLASHGDHFNRGGGPMLDRELYDADLSGAGYYPPESDGIEAS